MDRRDFIKLCQLLGLTLPFGPSMVAASQSSVIIVGAEWLHVPPSILNDIVNDESVTVDIQTTAYDPEQDIVLLDGKPISLEQCSHGSTSCQACSQQYS